MARTTAPPGWSSARAQFLHSLLSDDYRPEHLSCLLWPRAHPPLMAGRRNALILSRVRALSLVFAVLTLLWIPVVRQTRATVIAVNLGGAVIPVVLSLYLLVRHELYVLAAIATTCVAAVCHFLARPVPGFGIALPIFVPASATAIIALALTRRRAAPLAYISGSCGVLIGADLLNLGAVRSLGAPVASIGGAGTFDGIYLTGLLALLYAGLSRYLSK